MNLAPKHDWQFYDDIVSIDETERVRERTSTQRFQVDASKQQLALILRNKSGNCEALEFGS